MSSPATTRYSDLSVARKALVRLCQRINYGQIRELRIENSEPILSPPPEVLVDLKLESEEKPRPEIDLADFQLGSEVRRLMGWLDQLRDETIERVEIRAGIPRRLVVRQSCELRNFENHTRLQSREGNRECIP